MKVSNTERIVGEVATERQRQVDVEGYGHKQDDGYSHGILALAGVAYAFHAAVFDGEKYTQRKPSAFWPWSASVWKPTNPRRDLIKAAALIVAEIERMDRAGKE